MVLVVIAPTGTVSKVDRHLDNSKMQLRQNDKDKLILRQSDIDAK